MLASGPSVATGGLPSQEAAAAGSDTTPDAGEAAPTCCPLYHDAVELIGRRWTGAILDLLMQRDSLRFSEIAHGVPALSDRLLSERIKELEARGLVCRTVRPGRPPQATYTLTEMGWALAPALAEVKAWAQRWLGGGRDQGATSAPAGGRPPRRCAGIH